MDLNVITDENYNVVGVKATLSRRNILALLHKLGMDGSFRTIARQCSVKTRDGDEREVMLVLDAEEDLEHYAERSPGPMRLATEGFIGQSGGVIALQFDLGTEEIV